jgi:hypothetical protein
MRPFVFLLFSVFVSDRGTLSYLLVFIVFQYGLKKKVMGPGDKADHWMDRAKKRYILIASISQK